MCVWISFSVGLVVFFDTDLILIEKHGVKTDWSEFVGERLSYGNELDLSLLGRDVLQ